MADELTADRIIALLQLEPNATCGFVRTTYVSTQSVAAGGLPPPFADARPIGSALYFLVTPSAPVRLHRIRNDQLYHYYLAVLSRSCCCARTAPARARWSAPISPPASRCSC
jgi:uncharacterized protein